METLPVKRRRQSEEKDAIQSIDNILYHDVMIIVTSYLQLKDLILLRGVSKENVLMALVSKLIEEAPHLKFGRVPLRMCAKLRTCAKLRFCAKLRICAKYCKNIKRIDFPRPAFRPEKFENVEHILYTFKEFPRVSQAIQLLIRQNHSSITAVHSATELYFHHSHAFGFMNLTYLDIGHVGSAHEYIYRYLLHDNFPNLQTLHLKIEVGPEVGPVRDMLQYFNLVENELPKFKSLTALSLQTFGPLQNFTHLKSLAVMKTCGDLGDFLLLRQFSPGFPNVFENFANLDSLIVGNKGGDYFNLCKMFGKCRVLKTLRVGTCIQFYLYPILQNVAGTLEDLELCHEHVLELPHDFRLPNVKRLRLRWIREQIDLDRLCFLFPNVEIFAIDNYLAEDIQSDVFVTLAKNGWSLKEIGFGSLKEIGFDWRVNIKLLPKIIFHLLDENVFPDLEILTLPRKLAGEADKLFLVKSIRDILKKRKHCIVKNACCWNEM